VSTNVYNASRKLTTKLTTKRPRFDFGGAINLQDAGTARCGQVFWFAFCPQEISMPTIDVTAEETLTLDQAAAMLPAGRNGARPTFGCVLRWVLEGARPVGPDGKPNGEKIRLDAVRLGGRWITSCEAINRFVDRLTPRLDGAAVAPKLRAPAKRARSSEHAAEELEKAWGKNGPRK
jgi:hypothetical protein